MIDSHDTVVISPKNITQEEVSGVSPDYESTGSKQPYSLEESSTVERGAIQVVEGCLILKSS